MEPVNPLRVWRKAKGYKLREVAWLVGVSGRTIAAFESGDHGLSPKCLTIFAQLMGRSPDDLEMELVAWNCEKRQQLEAKQ